MSHVAAITMTLFVHKDKFLAVTLVSQDAQTTLLCAILLLVFANFRLYLLLVLHLLQAAHHQALRVRLVDLKHNNYTDMLHKQGQSTSKLLITHILDKRYVISMDAQLQ